MSQLIEHYRRRELFVDNTWTSYATKVGYENYLKRWIAPKWGSYPVAKVKPIEVESWLRQLPLARGSCAKISFLLLTEVMESHGLRNGPVHQSQLPCST
jgi:integrase